MKIVHDSEIQGDRYTGQYARAIKHLCTPWTLGSRHVWVGVIEYEPHCTSNMHDHDVQEEVFYCISGEGQVIVDGETEPLTPGACVYVPPKTLHQIVNTSDEVLKVLSAVSPPFKMEQYKKDHNYSN